ncbi:hypothetical protein HYT26_00670 [Candidatus Pacearchaeota archaeon]|nr:hypothetical protein [Candidatus Pacearchaeota archaeon]
MEIKLKGNGKIDATEIYTPHLGEVLAFKLSISGPDYYNYMTRKINYDKRLMPTTAQTLSLVDLALQNLDEEHCQNIINQLRKNDFWTSTENLLTFKEVIVYDNVDEDMPSDKKSLIKRYKDGDKSVRIVPYGFKTGEQSVGEFLKNPYVIAQIGNKDMLDVVERVAKGIGKRKPCVHDLGSEGDREDVKRYTWISNCFRDDRLDLYGRLGDDNKGSVSSVRRLSATAAKNN